MRNMRDTTGKFTDKSGSKTRINISKSKERKGGAYSKSFLAAHFQEKPNLKINQLVRDVGTENRSCDFENPRYKEDALEEKLKRWTKTTLEDLNSNVKEEQSLGFLEKKLITQYGKEDAVEGWDLDTSKSDIDLAAHVNENKINHVKRKKSVGKKS